MRGLQTDRTAQVVIAGRAFLQKLRRGHYELAVLPCGSERRSPNSPTLSDIRPAGLSVIAELTTQRSLPACDGKERLLALARASL
jgi:hypothetical protein